MSALKWRHDVTPADIGRVRALCTATGFFTLAEVAMAGELVEARLTEGARSGYDFVLAEETGALVGYACFGAIEGTDSSFDLYWIVVDPARHGGGIGRKVLHQAEAAMRAAGCTRYYAETSSTEKYAPTRRFYSKAGFLEVAHIADFYRAGDGKIIYERVL
jgi:GNAT superfamily N-acetyltransferase